MSFKPTSFHVLERQLTQNHIVWTYPTINEDLKALIVQICYYQGFEATGLYYYVRIDNQWVYIKQFISKNDKPAAIIVTSHYYQPNLYEIICDLLVTSYSNEKNFVHLVQIYLNIYITNGVSVENNFINLSCFPWKTDVKGIIKHLGIEIILVYNALLLKKQILVYHPNIEELQESLASLTRLISFRKPEDFLQPFIRTVTELRKTSKYYLIGTTNKSLINQKNVCEIIVDLESKFVDYSPNPRDFELCYLHKEVAQFLLQISESEETEKRAIESISNKTSEILKLLNKLKNNEGKIEIEDIGNKKNNKNLVKFLISLAKAENILVI
ncbi:DENN domain-containing protein 10-like [Diorhabda carinulata]|uniref:DENN domain-containing protein 10-like n=1 Tax=Diorhabda carinulata TaxID=1163345 RepID=UPI00259FEEFD|nr:DENN domain-containing protein 10-like [Diorhabda carinulata]